MKIRFLGVGAALNTINIGSSILVDETILIDAPPAIPAMLLRYNINIENISHVFISHLHGDHYFGFPFLLLEYMITKRNDYLNVFGSKSLRNNTIELLRLSFPESDPEKLIAYSKSIFNELKIGNSINVGSYNIIPVSAKHSIETFGFRFERHNSIVFYSSDTEMTKSTYTNINDADIIIVDATTRGVALQGHIDLEEIIKCAKQNEKKMFYIMHRSNYSFKDVKVPNIVFPNDGDEFNV